MSRTIGDLEKHDINEELEAESHTYKLRPCPFCGSTKIVLKRPYPVMELWFVTCLGCSCNSACSTKPIDAVSAWNMRVDNGES